MNKSELIEVLSSRLGGRAQAAAAVEALVDVVLREVAAGRSVGITGFGTFEKVDRAPRTGRNPRTGEAVPIAGTSTPRFRPGAYFKDVVADPSALPAQGLAGARVGSSDGVERTGAPATVRRTGKAAGPSADKTTKATGAAKTTKATKATGGGAPESVRKAPQTSAPRAGQGKKSSSEKPATGRVMAGGEEITHGMISAKKAQLARVKNDELAAKNKKKSRATAAQKVEGADPETSKAKVKSKVKSKDKLKPKDKGKVKLKPKDEGKVKSKTKDKLKPKKGAKTNKDKGKGPGKQR